MAIITDQDFINVKRDIDDIDKSLNTKAIINPRWGDSFKSLPLAIQEVIETGGFEPFATEAQLKASVPTLTKKAAYALDTHNIFLWENGVWGNTGSSELDLAKKYSDQVTFAPVYAKEDFESGYLETFFDSYKTVNQYVPARYSNGFAQIIEGTSTKKLELNNGLSIRFKIKYSTFNPLMVLALTDSPHGWVSSNNIGIVSGSSLTNAFHFRTPNSSLQPIASSLSKKDIYNNAYAMELIIQGGILTLKRYDEDFSQEIESYSQTVDREAYKSYKYLTLYTQATTWFSLIEINYFNAKTLIKSDSINPSWFNNAATYMFNDWSRRSNSIASAVQSFGRNGQLLSKANTIEIDIDVDTANITDGFLIGFGNTPSSSDRVAIGYEPAASYRGLVFLNGTSSGAVFTRIVPTDQLIDGIYRLVLSKSDTYYRYQVYKPDGLLLIDREYRGDLATSRQLYISAKYTTASKTLVKDVRLKQGVSLEVKPRQSDGFKDLTGRNLVQEQFGGEGDDWCFVYTPKNYSITSKAHKFVIFNHGNGWTVSSNPATANFSSKTQFGVDTQNDGAYLDTSRPDYVQYSSPLIEILLANGYVVCGATNYADGLYGNNNCRNAVVDFYSYMRKNYNVTDRCHMIGASNGAMTTLNACHLLTSAKVASIALVYPLASLFDHYLAYSAHRPNILSAYSLTGNTYANLAALKAEKAFFTHCPVHHFIVGDDLAEQQIKTLALPPMHVVSSTGDTVTAAASNGKKLKDLSDRSSLACNYTDIDPAGTLGYNHGDWHHFKESEILSFFLANK